MKAEIRHGIDQRLMAARRAICAATIGACLLALLGLPLDQSEAKSKVGKMPKEAVAQQALNTFDGQKYTLAGLRGKVVVLNFFAVWCGHSRDQIPALTKYTADDLSRGLQIIGQAVQDDQTTLERVREFISQQKIGYPVGMTDDRKFSSYIDSRDVGVPQTLVYGRDGRLIAYFNGQNAQNDAALDRVIQSELNKK